MNEINLSINDLKVKAKQGRTVLEAAQEAGVYIPALCSHPGLPPAREMESLDSIYRGSELIKGDKRKFVGCELCLVEIEGEEELAYACTTPVTEGMVLHTDTPRVQGARQGNLARILAAHPHACLTCAQREGCSREPCSANVPVDERCCPKFGNCELQRVAEYIKIKEDTPRYISKGIPIFGDEPLFIRDYNLCIGCMRCVRVCQDVQGVGALGFTYRNGEIFIGSIKPSLMESGCKFCTACVAVCPTGALMDKDPHQGAERRKKLGIEFTPVTLPPDRWLQLNPENLGTVPETEGVYQLLDEDKNVIYIAGTVNLQRDLEEQLNMNERACYFGYEEDPMYTKRESELLQQHLQEHGKLPELNDELDELF